MRILHFRVTFAVLGLLALMAGALLDTTWLAGSGAAAAAVSDLIGIARARVRHPEPLLRLLRATCEALPSIGVAAYEPLAIGVAVAVVLYALMAAGLETVSVSRGLTLGNVRGETSRRVTSALCSMALLGIPAALAWGRTPQSLIGRDAGTVAAVVVSVAILVALRGMLDVALEVRAAGKRATAQNVDS